MLKDLILEALEPKHYEDVIALGNKAHGSGYLCEDSLNSMQSKGCKNGINSSFVLYKDQQLIGFRITYAPDNWEIDQYCSPHLWNIPAEKVAYFKGNTIAEEYQGQGLGGILLRQSVEALKQMGALAGVSHIWMQSPGNASYKYFSKAGGKLIKLHEDRWLSDPNFENYICNLCGKECHCSASEMLLEF